MAFGKIIKASNALVVFAVVILSYERIWAVLYCISLTNLAETPWGNDAKISRI